MASQSSEQNQLPGEEVTHASNRGGMAGSIAKGVHAASRACSWVALVAIVAMLLSVFIDVVTRTANRPLPGNIDIAEILMIPAAYFAMAHTHVLKGHVRVEIVYDRLPKRLKAIFDSITFLLATGVYGFVIAAMARRAWAIFTSPDQGPVTLLLGIPTAPLFMVIAVALAVLCLELLVSFAEAVAGKASR